MPFYTTVNQPSKWRSTPDLFSKASKIISRNERQRIVNNFKKKNTVEIFHTSKNLDKLQGSPPTFHLASDSIRKSSSPVNANNLRVNTSNIYSLNSASSSNASNSTPNSASNVQNLFSQGQIISNTKSNKGRHITYPIPLNETLNGFQNPHLKGSNLRNGALASGQFSKTRMLGHLNSANASLISSMEEGNEDEIIQNTSSSSSNSNYNNSNLPLFDDKVFFLNQQN